jgi:DUF971 family protein
VSRRAVRPEEIGPSADASQLRIRWADGHVSHFPPRYLLLACRCAGCIDEFTGELILQPDQVAAEVHPLAIHYVGRYAIQFDWSDGHTTGIFPFDYLRDLCPCGECQNPGGSAGSPEAARDGGGRNGDG